MIREFIFKFDKLPVNSLNWIKSRRNRQYLLQDKIYHRNNYFKVNDSNFMNNLVNGNIVWVKAKNKFNKQKSAENCPIKILHPHVKPWQCLLTDICVNFIVFTILTDLCMKVKIWGRFNAVDTFRMCLWVERGICGTNIYTSNLFAILDCLV